MCTKRILKFCYHMELDFSQPVQKHQFTLRMVPCTDERQQITACEFKVTPECRLYEDVDTFGNRYVYGEIQHQHVCFSVEVRGQAEIDKTKQISGDGSMAMLAPYRFQSRYTKTGSAIKEYYQRYGKKEGEDAASFAAGLLHQIYEDMEYKQGVTDISTTAEQALAGKMGVCQDYAHIMISLCRMADIPSRYVVGMMQGEGFSHAWVELYISGHWVGFDPTNNRMVDDTYIKISHGRDYQDCIVNRGVFHGTGTQTQHVKVVVV